MSDVPYYTNSSHLPVGYTDDIFSALDIQDELQTLYTSGTVFHAFLGEKLPDWKAAARLVRKIAENYKLPYYTLSPTYSVCKNHGYLQGEQKVCPDCNSSTEVYSRITGYYRPVGNWNTGKAQEYKERKEYVVDEAALNRDLGRAPAAECACSEKKAEKSVLTDGSYLFVSATCPNCKIAHTMLDKAGYQYKELLATENAELANSLGVKQAPTLVVVSGGKVEKYAGVGAIKAIL